MIKELKGNKFGKLTVLYDYIDETKKKERHYCHCICDCENHTEINVKSSSLTSGNTKSCGCLNYRSGKDNEKFIDRSGNIINNWDIIEYIGNRYYRCKCTLCGNYYNVLIENIVSGKSKMCKSCMGKHSRKLNRGDVFGYLTVDSFVKEDNKWKCICTCGNECYVSAGHLLNRSIISCGHISPAHAGSYQENDIFTYIADLNCGYVYKANKLLDGKEIDIYLPEHNLGIEYNGSAYHATVGNVFKDKDKYYHRDKFLLAKSKGIHLISVFDIDYETNKDKILSYIKDCIFKTVAHEIPTEDIVYTNNDYDDGLWLKKYGYKEVGQIEPESFEYNNKFIVYRSGKTKWSRCV